MNVFNEAFKFQEKFKIPKKDPDVAWWWPNIELNGIVLPPRTFEKLDEEECGTTSPLSDLKQNSRVIGRTTNDCREERDEARFFAAEINRRVKRIRVPDTTGNRFAAMNNSEIAPSSSNTSIVVLIQRLITLLSRTLRSVLTRPRWNFKGGKRNENESWLSLARLAGRRK